MKTSSITLLPSQTQPDQSSSATSIPSLSTLSSSIFTANTDAFLKPKNQTLNRIRQGKTSDPKQEYIDKLKERIGNIIKENKSGLFNALPKGAKVAYKITGSTDDKCKSPSKETECSFNRSFVGVLISDEKDIKITNKNLEAVLKSTLDKAITDQPNLYPPPEVFDASGKTSLEFAIKIPTE